MVQIIQGNNKFTAATHTIIATDEADRLTFVAAQPGWVAYEVATNSVWFLAQVSPVHVWIPISGGDFSTPLIITGAEAIPPTASLIVLDIGAGFGPAAVLPALSTVAEGKTFTILTSRVDFATIATVNVAPADVDGLDPPIDDSTNTLQFDAFRSQAITLSKVTVGGVAKWRSSSSSTAPTSFISGGGLIDSESAPVATLSEVSPAGTPIGLGGAGSFSVWTTGTAGFVTTAPYVEVVAGLPTVRTLGVGLWFVMVTGRIVGTALASITARLQTGPAVKTPFLASPAPIVFGAAPVPQTFTTQGVAFVGNSGTVELAFASSLPGDTVTLFAATMSAFRIGS